MTNEQTEENCRQITRELSPWIDPLDADERRALERFSRLVEELEGHKIFCDLLQQGQIDWRLRIEDGNVVSAHIEKLDETELGAFVPLARLFTQKREHASIRKIAAIFDRRVSDRHPIWWNFNAYRVGLRQFLALTAPNLSETFGKIFDIFINGHYVHREDERRRDTNRGKRKSADLPREKSRSCSQSVRLFLMSARCAITLSNYWTSPRIRFRKCRQRK